MAEHWATACSDLERGWGENGQRVSPRPGAERSGCEHDRGGVSAGAVARDGGRKRSEVDRRLDLCVVGRERRLKVDMVGDFVRLFNMCDISPPNREDDSRQGSVTVRGCSDALTHVRAFYPEWAPCACIACLVELSMPLGSYCA
jgi:hypothetical protein